MNIKQFAPHDLGNNPVNITDLNMAVLRLILKALLSELINLLIAMVDRGDCDKITPETIEQLKDVIHQTNKLSADAARKHLGISRTRFYQLKANKLGKKVKGFKELVFDLGDLEKFKKMLMDAEKVKKMLYNMFGFSYLNYD